jgi:cysteine synthase A
MSRVVRDLTELVGDTPLVRLNAVKTNEHAEIYVKLEFQNPGKSVKDRIALQMIKQAEAEGKLNENSTIIEPTSGNTGIGLAWISAVKGYRVILVMPDSMSKERRALLKAFGAELVLTPGSLGMKGAIEKARELNGQIENSIILNQFRNPANAAAHYETTGPEIARAIDSIGGRLDAFVCGVGTGGTITGTGRYLKEHYPDIQIIGVEPAASPVLTGGKPSPHPIQGIGAGFIPEILDQSVYDEIIDVETEDAYRTSRLVAQKEGILAGISSGAILHGALQVARRLGGGKRIVAIVPSNGERYLSTALYNFDQG